MTISVTSGRFGEFKEYLEHNGYSFEGRPYQEFLARKGSTVVNLYTNGKIVIGGQDSDERARIEQYIFSLGGAQISKSPSKTARSLPAIGVSGIRIGTDEVGKGDYFGPLVVGGAAINETQVKQLDAVGVKDSKELTDKEIAKIAGDIRRLLKPAEYTIVTVGPSAYNRLYCQMKNLNRILAWGHARAIENLLTTNSQCATAVADQFGDESYITKALMEKGKSVKLIQTPKGEREIAVAAASIMARDEFIRRLHKMSENYRIQFPKGSSNVIAAAEQFIQKHGGRELVKVAKVHFSITEKIRGLAAEDIQWLRGQSPCEKSDKDHHLTAG